MQFIGKIMGDPNKKDIRAIQPLIDKINALEPAMKKLSNEELAAKTAEFRSQLFLHLKGGLVLEDELVKLFREALNGVEPMADKCSDAQLHAAVTEYRQRIERGRNPEQDLRDDLPATLSECFETGYAQLALTWRTSASSGPTKHQTRDMLPSHSLKRSNPTCRKLTLPS